MPALRKSGEDYLEAIWVLKQSKGIVHSIDVANHLGFSKPSVSRAVSLLREEAYLDMAENGELTLTEKGMNAATEVYGRHKILAAILEDLGVPPEIAAEDACQVEHVLSEVSFNCVRAHYYQNHSPDKPPQNICRPKEED